MLWWPACFWFPNDELTTKEQGDTEKAVITSD